MRIDTPQKTNFRARFIRNVQIEKINPKSKTYQPQKVAFLEYEPKNEKDLSTIFSAVKTWKNKLYAGRIAENAALINQGHLSGKKNHIYILSKQNGNFENLNENDVLGLAHMVNDDGPFTPELRFFEVKPDFKYGSKSREYKHIGEGIIESLKQIYNDSIRLISSYSAANFYEKQGFEIIDTDLFEYLWRAKK